MQEKYYEQLEKEFDRQVENLFQKEYPHIAGLKAEDFIKHIEPLKEQLCELAAPETETPNGHIPFVIVIKNDLVAAESAMPLIEIKGKQGYVGMYPVEPGNFKPIEGLPIPGSTAYLLVDINTGRDTLNVTPYNALRRFEQEKRSPLTIDEGVALVTHFPQVLTDKKRYSCFSILGSRGNDQRVPAIWMSYKKPRLGWCWDNNPHTWLGSASCGSRLAPVSKN